MGTSNSCCETSTGEDNIIPSAAQVIAGYVPQENDALDVFKVGEDRVEQKDDKARPSFESSLADAKQTHQFTMQFDPRAKENVGLNLDALEGFAAFVDDIGPGAVQNWNKSHPDSKQLLVNDKIVCINGVSCDTTQIVAEMKATTEWHLTVMRPRHIKVEVNSKKEGNFGLDLKYSPTGKTLLVAAVGDGAVRRWNDSAEVKIMNGDRIFGINGATGLSKTLLQAASETTELEIDFLHYS